MLAPWKYTFALIMWESIICSCIFNSCKDFQERYAKINGLLITINIFSRIISTNHQIIEYIHINPFTLLRRSNSHRNDLLLSSVPGTKHWWSLYVIFVYPIICLSSLNMKDFISCMYFFLAKKTFHLTVCIFW